MAIEFIEVVGICHCRICTVEVADSVEDWEHHNEKSTEFVVHEVFIENTGAMSATAATTSQSSDKVSGDGQDAHDSEYEDSECWSTSNPESTSVIFEISFWEK